MRALHNNFRLSSRSQFTALFLAATVVVTGIVTYAFSGRTADAAAPDAPTINSFVITDSGNNSWTFSGTVSSSEGLEGMVLYFGGPVIDEVDAPETDGSFSIDVTCEPQAGDWAEVYATDRWGIDSDTVDEDFFEE
jgi:hypothetical protein